MPLDHRFDEERNLVTSRMRGEIDAATLLAHVEALVQDARVERGCRFYYDLAEAEPGHLEVELVRKGADLASRFIAANGPIQVAIYAPSDVTYGLARMYASLTDGLERQLGVFRKEAEAWEWLRL